MTWVEVLDALMRNVEEAELALDNEQPLPINSFNPPHDIEPLPAELEERALQVLARQRDLELRVENVKHSLTREITQMTRAQRSTGASAFSHNKTPSFFDSKA